MNKSDRKQFWLFLGVLTLLSGLMIFFYLPSGKIYYGYDCSFHLMRLNALMDSFGNGTFPIYVDYNAALGYGYGTKWFYSDVILIPFAILGNVTSLMFAYKVMLFTISILCGLFTYMAVKRIYKNAFAASVSGILYTFCLYRLMDLFDRAALGESISFTFVPLVIWGLYEIIGGNYKRWYILAIGYSLLLFTHLLSTVTMFGITLAILIIYFRPLIREKVRFKYLLLSGIVSLLITAYFWLPMLEQMMTNSFYVNTQRVGSVEDHTISASLLLKGLVDGFFPSTKELMPGIGILLTLVVCLRVFVREKTECLKSADIGVILGVLCILACLPQFPWGTFPFSRMSVLQVPWRLFIYPSFFFAVAGGYYLSQVVKKDKYRILIMSALVVCTIGIMLVKSDGFKNSNESEDPRMDRAYSNLGNMEYFPSKVPGSYYIDERKDSVTTLYIESKVTNLVKEKGVTSFDVELNSSEKIELPLLYYKGYKAKLGDADLTVAQSEHGLVEVSVNDSGHITVYYGGTFIQKFSYYFSILCIVILCVYIYRSNKGLKKAH